MKDYYDEYDDKQRSSSKINNFLLFITSLLLISFMVLIKNYSVERREHQTIYTDKDLNEYIINREKRGLYIKVGNQLIDENKFLDETGKFMYVINKSDKTIKLERR